MRANVETHSGLTAERLRELLDYDKETGVFRWKARRRGINVGATTGTHNGHGYTVIQVDKHLYMAHRLAWLWCKGEWPKADIDHMDGNRANNAISNLRDVPRSLNAQNLKRALRRNTTGLLGVTKRKGGWIARIHVNGEVHHLGTFQTPELAQDAYATAKKLMHPGFIGLDQDTLKTRGAYANKP
jgi:hypothetical protein